MLRHVVIAMLGTAGLMLVWIAIQRLRRRIGPPGSDERDVLSCADCGSASCTGCAGFRAAVSLGGPSSNDSQRGVN